MSVLTQVENETLLKEAFSAWADVYDLRQNPLLMLEERYLLRLLPAIQGRDVLDVGCGTGRWLARLSRWHPKSLQGVDFSSQMLSKGAARHIPDTRLSLAPCTELPLADANVDVLLSSFVLSYVDDLDKAAREFARVIRPGGNLILTDMHPETAAALHWKRAFTSNEVKTMLPAKHRGIEEIIAFFRNEGFMVRASVEPFFGLPEKVSFAAHNKIDSFAEAEHLPAIYLLHLVKSPAPDTQSQSHKRLLYGGQCAFGPCEKTRAAVMIDKVTVATVSSRTSTANTKFGSAVDLSGYLLFPGLMNAHDHLEFALFPKLGRGPYQNAEQWAQDIQQNHAELIALHRSVPKRTRLWWGGIRNLLCGVTTVCHHNPISACLLEQDFPVRVILNFGWEHSLAFAADMKAAYDNTPEGHTFIIHAAEGIDEGSSAELRTLDELGVLDQRTVIVHGLAFRKEEAGLLNGCGASLIVCPSSNHFLFGKTPSPELLHSVNRLALGSDSPLTAAGDLLDEIRFVAQTCGLSAQRLYSLVTDSASSILRIEGGSIRPGCQADLVAVRDRDGEPAEILCSLSANDIELVVLEGRVQLASESIFDRLPQDDREGLEALSMDGNIRWLRAPVHDLLREAENVLGKGQVHLEGHLLCQP